MRVLAFLIAVLFAGPVWGANYNVTSDAEMLAALAADADSDTITITSSFSSGSTTYTVDKNITISASSPSITITLGDDTAYLFTVASGSNGATIQDFTIDLDKGNRTTGTAFLVQSDSVTISGVTIQDAFNYGILAANTAQGTAITSCSFSGTGGAGINKNTAGNAIRVNDGGTATISGCDFQETSSAGDTIFINSANGCTISGNTLDGAGLCAIKLYSGADSNTVSGNTITDWAKSAAGDAISVDGVSNVISNNTITQSTDASTAWGIEITGGADACDGTAVSGNTIGGAHLDRAISGGGSYVIFSRNTFTCSDCVLYQNCDASVFRENVVITDAMGFKFEAAAAGAKTVFAINNTLYNDGGESAIGIYFNESVGTFGVSEIKSNIIYGFDYGVVIDDKDDDGIAVTHTYNDYYGSLTANIVKDVLTVKTALDLGTGEITTDPLFIDAAGGNFHLTPLSPALSAGYDGNNIGAYQDRVSAFSGAGGVQ